MTALQAAGDRLLPRGWLDLWRQLAIWFGFFFVYQLARGIADRNPTKAFADGLRVVDVEQRLTNHLVELTAQRFVDSYGVLATLATWTYWNSEFTVVFLALFWVYLRRHEHFHRFRNLLLLANVIGLVGYVLMPTAPPRMFNYLGFVDRHHDGIVQLAANPYAAMPSLHAADALIVGVMLAYLARRPLVRLLWLLWAPWVWFSVIATANHFWLDVAGGILVALISAAVIYRHRLRALISPAAAF